MGLNIVKCMILFIASFPVTIAGYAQDAKVADSKKEESTKSTNSAGSIDFFVNGTSPYDLKTPLRFRLAYFDRASVGIQWDREMERRDLTSEKTPTEGELLLRLMKLNAEEQKRVNELFATRKSEHDKNAAILLRISLEEMDDYLRDAGAKGPIRPVEERLDASPEDTENLLQDYINKEYEAERTLALALKDAMDPFAYRILVDRWIHYDNIGNPLMTTHLELTDDQIGKVREACGEFKELNNRFEREASGQQDAVKSNGSPADKSEWWDARFKMYSYLTPQQFRHVAHLLFNERDSSPSFFKKRLSIAKTRAEKFNVPIATAEYRALGDLYRKGIAELEDTN